LRREIRNCRFITKPGEDEKGGTRADDLLFLKNFSNENLLVVIICQGKSGRQAIRNLEDDFVLSA
jgi:hypothetical protein